MKHIQKFLEHNIDIDLESLSLPMQDGTLVVSAFPGCGKSYFFENSDIKTIDSDSSKFDKSDFPKNYIEHIRENLGKQDIIFVSSHKEVREALVNENINFILVYPNITLKDEYISRYETRGNDEKFVELLNNKWDEWTTDCFNQSNCYHIQLNSGQFLSDVIK